VPCIGHCPTLGCHAPLVFFSRLLRFTGRKTLVEGGLGVVVKLLLAASAVVACYSHRIAMLQLGDRDLGLFVVCTGCRWGGKGGIEHCCTLAADNHVVTLRISFRTFCIRASAAALHCSTSSERSTMHSIVAICRAGWDWPSSCCSLPSTLSPATQPLRTNLKSSSKSLVPSGEAPPYGARNTWWPP